MSSAIKAGSSGSPTPPMPVRGIPGARDWPAGSVAGDEKGWSASTTNMISARRSVAPLLDTCSGVPPRRR